jgi:uncharacterized protein (DUF1499 family)
LAPCPETPNCVCSQAAGSAHVAPFAFAGDPQTVMARLQSAVASMPRVRLLVASPTYLHAEARSRVLGFVDDVEFLLDPAAGIIHVRSASRLGRSDFGVNRRRVEAIRARFLSGTS